MLQNKTFQAVGAFVLLAIFLSSFCLHSTFSNCSHSSASSSVSTASSSSSHASTTQSHDQYDGLGKEAWFRRLWNTVGAAKESSTDEQEQEYEQDQEEDEDSTEIFAQPQADDDNFDETLFDFQKEREFVQPNRDLTKYKDYTPHNYKSKMNRQTFATYLCTRNSSLQDPYFSATQQLVYRNLWATKTASRRRPFTVFVAPYISQEQRDLLAGAGAIVRELDLIDWQPNTPVWGRWRDTFAKLNLWAQTDFSAIAFMDSDAFPISNIDDVFDLAKPRKCDASQLSKEDLKDKKQLCDYTIAGVDFYGSDEVNTGFLVLQPNAAMHARLLRETAHADHFDNSMAEQGFLHWIFRNDGPFPHTQLPRAYNGIFVNDDDEGKLKVVHEKLWTEQTVGWMAGLFDKSWEDMLAFYDSEEFVAAREADDQPL